MKIFIDYDSTWRNSFLDGDNNLPLPIRGRNYLGSMTTLKKAENFIQRDITLDTVMGVLNRLIGDQRKLYQARAKEFEQEYYFADIEQKIAFVDHSTPSSEIVYIRNTKGSTDQNSFTGMIKSHNPMFSSQYSGELWGVLDLDFDSVCQFICDDTKTVKVISTDPLSVCERMDELAKVKPLEVSPTLEKTLATLANNFPNTSYLNPKGQVIVRALYCSALYLQLERLSQRFDLTDSLTSSGLISGISKKGFTKKDFMDRFTTGKKKLLWGNPYIKKEKLKGEGEVVSMLTKASGQLEITLNIDQQKAQELKVLIENAGVSSFYFGKKGLAYVSKIRV